MQSKHKLLSDEAIGFWLFLWSFFLGCFVWFGFGFGFRFLHVPFILNFTSTHANVEISFWCWKNLILWVLTCRKWKKDKVYDFSVHDSRSLIFKCVKSGRSFTKIYLHLHKNIKTRNKIVLLLCLLLMYIFCYYDTIHSAYPVNNSIIWGSQKKFWSFEVVQKSYHFGKCGSSFGRSTTNTYPQRMPVPTLALWMIHQIEIISGNYRW